GGLAVAGGWWRTLGGGTGRIVSDRTAMVPPPEPALSPPPSHTSRPPACYTSGPEFIVRRARSLVSGPDARGAALGGGQCGPSRASAKDDGPRTNWSTGPHGSELAALLALGPHAAGADHGGRLADPRRQLSVAIVQRRCDPGLDLPSRT